MTINTPLLINLPCFLDHRGSLSVVERHKDIPYAISRVYWIYGVPPGERRGAHAHRSLSQLLVAVNGSFSVTVDDGREKTLFALTNPSEGLYIPPGVWGTLHDFSADAVCLVLASASYEEDDYIRSYDDFITLKRSQRDD